MQCQFFTKQKVDKAGVLAVRFEIFLIVLAVYIIVGFGLDVYSLVTSDGSEVFRHLGLMGLRTLVWSTTFFVGWRGAIQRKTSFLLAFVIICSSLLALTILLYTAVASGVFMTIWLIRIFAENDCRSLGEIFSDSSFLLALGQLVVLLVLPLVIYSVGIYLAAVTRKELLKLGSLGHSLTLQEEGLISTAGGINEMQEFDAQGSSADGQGNPHYVIPLEGDKDNSPNFE